PVTRTSNRRTAMGAIRCAGRASTLSRSISRHLPINTAVDLTGPTGYEPLAQAARHSRAPANHFRHFSISQRRPTRRSLMLSPEALVHVLMFVALTVTFLTLLAYHFASVRNVVRMVFAFIPHLLEEVE